jgi:hypothetical protein
MSKQIFALARSYRAASAAVDRVNNSPDMPDRKADAIVSRQMKAFHRVVAARARTAPEAAAQLHVIQDWTDRYPWDGPCANHADAPRRARSLMGRIARTIERSAA